MVFIRQYREKKMELLKHTNEKLKNTRKKKKSSLQAWKNEQSLEERSVDDRSSPRALVTSFAHARSVHHGKCTTALALLLLPQPHGEPWTSTAHALIISMAPSERDGKNISFEVAFDGRIQACTARVASRTTTKVFMAESSLAVSVLRNSCKVDKGRRFSFVLLQIIVIFKATTPGKQFLYPFRRWLHQDWQEPRRSDWRHAQTFRGKFWRDSRQLQLDLSREPWSVSWEPWRAFDFFFFPFHARRNRDVDSHGYCIVVSETSCVQAFVHWAKLKIPRFFLSLRWWLFFQRKIHLRQVWRAVKIEMANEAMSLCWTLQTIGCVYVRVSYDNTGVFTCGLWRHRMFNRMFPARLSGVWSGVFMLFWLLSKPRAWSKENNTKNYWK